MSSIRRQLATFAVVLAALYGVGLAAGQIIDEESDAEQKIEHDSGH